MAEKKLVPELRFPEFEEEWNEVPLGSFLSFKNGVNASKEDYGSGYKFINVLDIIENNYITHDRIQGSVNIDADVFEKNRVNYGDVLFQRSSETREEVGQANVYLDEKPATFGGFVIRGKRISDYDPRYMNYLLRTPNSRKEIIARSGGSTRYNVGQSILNEIAVILAEIPEQQKIASFLSSVDERLRLLQQKKEKLERYKKGVMQKLFPKAGEKTPEIRFKDDDGKDFPEWEEKKLGEVADGIAYGMGSAAREFDGKTKYLRITDIDEYTHKFKPNPITSPEGIVDGKYLLKQGDIVFARTGASTGKTYIYDESDGTLAYAGFLIKFSITKAVPVFIFYKTLSYEYKKWVSVMSMRSGQPGINAEEYKQWKFQFPVLAEQQKIASFLSSLDRSIEMLETEIAGTEKFKKGLLQKMFV